MEHKKVYKICILSFLVAISIMLSYIEMLLPINIGIPGIKLGLANSMVILALFLFGKKEAVLIAFLKVFIMGLFFTGISMMLYSLSGTVCSLLVMIILYETKLFKMMTISMMGGMMHNVGQIICAMLIFSTSALLYYLPVLVITGLVTGLLIGLLSYMLYNRLNQYIKGKINE